MPSHPTHPDPLVAYWRDLAERNDAQVVAACHAAGAAGYYLGPYCHSSDGERLAYLRDVITDLRRALGLDHLDTTPTNPSTSTSMEGRES